MISKLRSVPLTIAPEPQQNANEVHQPALLVPSAGIANAPDSFESADPLKTGIFTFTQQQSNVDQMAQPKAEVDASTFFDYVADVQDPQPPAPPELPENSLNVTGAVTTDNSNRIDETINNVTQFAEDASNTVLDEGVKLFSAAGDFFTDVGDVAEDAIKEIAKPVGDVMYGDTVNDVVDFVSTEIVDRGLNGMRDAGLESEADWIQNTGGDVIRFAGKTAKGAGKVAEDVIDGIGDTGSDVGDFAEDVLDTVAEPVSYVLTGDAIDDVINTGEDAIGAIGDAVGDAADAAGDVIDDIGDAAGEGLDAIGDAAGDVGDWLDDLDWP
ncbi:hypothetical protein L0152_26175 [bacterium]|nr:hypothetical protein [bacterium]